MTAKVRTQGGGRRYRGRTKEELSEERRQRLLAAGEKLIGREGYAQTSIERLCTTARVSPRHFYEHFSSREALLSALFERFYRDALARAAAGMRDSGHQAIIDRALDAVRALVRHCMANPVQARIALVETVGVSREMEQRRRAMVHEVAAMASAIADELVAAGAMPEADYRLPSIGLVGATNELLVEWLSGGTDLDAEQMENQIAAIYRAVIEGGIVREHRRLERERKAAREPSRK